MHTYYAEAVRGIDLVLAVCTVSFSVVIILYVLVKREVTALRARRLRGIMTQLQGFAVADKQAMLDGCVLLMRTTAPLDFFGVVKHSAEILPERFSEQFMECLTDSGKITGIERDAQNTRDKWRRIEAIIMLGYLKSDRAVDILRRSLADRDADIAYFSLLALGRMKSAEAAHILLAAVRERAFNGHTVASLLEQFPPSIAETLVTGAGDRDAVVRFWAIKLLARFKPARYAQAISACTRDVSADVRAAACECLGQMGEQSSREAVRGCLHDTAWFVRLHAVRALEKILGPKSIPDIAPLLKDPHWFIKENVKELLAKHFPAARPAIEKFLSEDDHALTQACIEIIDTSGYCNTIVDDLISPDPESGMKAQRLLETLITAGAHFGIEGVLRKYPADVQQKVVAVIAAIDKKKAAHMQKMMRGDVAEDHSHGA